MKGLAHILAIALSMLPLEAAGGNVFVPWKSVQVELDDGCMASVSTVKDSGRLGVVQLQCGSRMEQVPSLDLKDIPHVDLKGIRIFVTPSIDDDTMEVSNFTSIEIPFAIRCGEMNITASAEFVFSKGKYLLRQLRSEVAPDARVGAKEISDICKASVH